VYLLSPKISGENKYIDDHKKIFIEYILEIANQLNPNTRHTVEEELKMFMTEMAKKRLESNIYVSGSLLELTWKKEVSKSTKNCNYICYGSMFKRQQ